MALGATLSDVEYELVPGIPKLFEEAKQQRFRSHQYVTLMRVLQNYLNRLDKSKYPPEGFIIYEDHYGLGLKPGNLYTLLMLNGIGVSYELVKDRKSIKIKGTVYSYNGSV